MIISHKYKFIFIKTRKTAGTSIEVALSRVLDDSDVATKVYPIEDGHFPRNFVLNGNEISSHCSAEFVRTCIGGDTFDSYYKFCVEREPVDKCISHYYMRLRSPSHNENTKFKNWREYMELANFPVDADKYLDSAGALLVDKIINYENLDAELGDIMRTLAVPFHGLNIRAKAGYRVQNLGEAELGITIGDKIKIYDAFAASNRLAGYKLNIE